MTRRPHGWRLGVLAIASMLLMLVAPAIRVSAQADAATEFGTVVGQLATMTPVAGPLSGSLDAANADSAPAGVSIANGVAHAEFTVPNVNAGTLWAMAVLFRVSDAGQNFLLIFPDGTWQLDNGQGGAAVTGTGATFDTTPGTTVAVDVLFDGPTGAFGLNGTFVSALDLTAIQGAGDVELTGYLGLGAGATTLDYANFSVYDLTGGSPVPTATTGGAVGAPTETATTAGLPVESPTAAGVPTESATAAAGLPTEAATTAAPTTAAGGDAAALFAQYLAQENSEPIVYGPESGTLIHDPEKVTFLDTGVTVSDFAAHIECSAPRTAAELWDCGLAFRDTSSPNHYRLGVVSDGHWFLSIGNQDPLQSGEGIPIPPNTGDKVALDLIVIGTTGYFGVDGTFVSELDLSALPGPGSVSAVIGFFNETYVAGGETPYEDFIVWNFDEGGAAPSETAVVGVPTQAPTVALPPVETPTTAAGLPTETPVAGLPTETPVAGTTAVTQPTTASGSTNVVGNTYTSPTFGYQLTWDPAWSVVTESSQNQFDVLRISNGAVTTDLYSGVSTMTLQDCITSLVQYYQGPDQSASYANVVLGTYADGQQILTQGNVAIATITFDYTDDTGATTATTDSVICVSMPTQGALVTMESYIPTAEVATQQAAVTALEAQLVVDGAPVVLPQVPATGGVPTQAATVGVPTEAVPTQAAPPASETAVAVPTVAAGDTAAFVLTSVGGGTVGGIGTLSGQARTVNVTAIT
ncbi:MAG TPA: hypothetical protein VFP05_11935, partial [Thermomicrobiales bacterium]|nr:hypothetical protein [Thermomicrobiales bacterium]